MLRNKALEDERIKLADIGNVLSKKKQELQGLENNLLNLKNSKNDYFDCFNPALIANYNSYIIKAENEISALKNQIKAIEVDFLNQKEKVKQAYIKVQTLEKLKEKQLETYKKELLLEEIKITDDIVTSRKRA